MSVSMTSSMEAPCSNIEAAIWAVRVDRILALTPLPSPSERTTMKEVGLVVILTESPHSSSPLLHRLSQATSIICLMNRVPLRATGPVVRPSSWSRPWFHPAVERSPGPRASGS